MMKRKQFLLALLAASVLVQPVLSGAKTADPAPAAAASNAQPYPAPLPPEIAAKAYVLIDATAGGQVLAAKNADMPVEPASLTKLMTGYLVFEALKNKRLALDQKLTVSQRAKTVEGSRMFIDTGWQVPVDDLIKGLIVQSGNDAANVLAEGVGGTIENFVQMMNNEAQRLGMTHSHFLNPIGLPQPGHVSTANDLALLTHRLQQDFPEYMHYYGIKKYRYPGTPVSNDTNRNTLLFRDPSVDGMKTGHTNEAGFCLVATAKREYPGVGPRRLISVVLGATSDEGRASESQKLLNWGYIAFEPLKLFAANQAVKEPAIWKGDSNTLPIGLPRDVVVAVPAGTASQVTTTLARPDPLLAPVHKGQAMGTLNISIAGRPYAQLPMQALKEVSLAGWFGRNWDALRLWIK